jgi:putative pyruvate formate lyase activating enzyme
MKRNFSQYLEHCECCPHNCGVNRLEGEMGICKISADLPIAYIGLHFGEEPPISGKNGSGTIFFAGCNLRCVFCQNFRISQEFTKNSFTYVSPETLAEEMIKLQTIGAHNVNLVSPSHVVFQVADAIKIAKNNGLTIPVVYNSNGYDSVESLKKISGLIDIYLPDIKYMDNRIAKEYSFAKSYADNVEAVLREMYSQVGQLNVDENGIAKHGLLVRHLVLPNNSENTKKCLSAVAKISPDIFISIMSQYTPMHKAEKLSSLNRPLSQSEYNETLKYAMELGLENAFIQELESQKTYLPDFEKEIPFDNSNLKKEM